MKMISPVSESAYSKAVVAEYGTLLFISGQESIDQDGRLLAPGDFTARSSKSGTTCEPSSRVGGELDNIATMTVYTTERRWGRQFTSGRKEIFKKGFPASAFVEARKLRTPGALLQIPAIAVLDERKRDMSELPEKIFIDPLLNLGSHGLLRCMEAVWCFLPVIRLEKCPMAAKPSILRSRQSVRLIESKPP
jgi:2-iminobutanoate/2-iminopropanoate deaminase